MHNASDHEGLASPESRAAGIFSDEGKKLSFSSYLEKHRIDLQTCLFAVLASIIVMISEFGSFTFVSDLYHIQLNNIFPNDGISADARFVPELLFQTIFYGTYLPSIFLLMLVCSLTMGGFLLIKRMDFLYGRKRILPILLLVLHPFLFAHSAYIVNRLQTSCSIIFAALAAFTISGDRYPKIVRIGLSGILLSLSVMSFQPAIAIFFVSALFLHADAIFERGLALKETLKHLATIALAIVIALVIYEGCVLLANCLHVIERVRVHNMMEFPVSTVDIQAHIEDLYKLLRKILFQRTQFFPIEVKWLLFANLAWLAVSVFRRGRTNLKKYWNVVFLIICFLSFFSTMIFVYPIIPMPRIMPGLAFAWFFVFVFAMKYEDRIGRSFAFISVLICVFVFAIQFNIMHERSTVKNEIDKQITWQLISKIQPIAGPRDEYKTVALVGVLSHRQLPYWTKYSNVYEGTLHPDIIQSVYDYDWSKYRLIEFYYPCRPPSDEQYRDAMKLVENSPLWPEEGSVVKGNGFIAVALSRP
jgi:hypothetical protein